MKLQPGSRIGAYEIHSLLGAGGMGEVYRGRDTRLDRAVAIKILPAPLALDADRVARFRREGRILSSLNHPRIAQIYALEDAHGAPALVMEFVEGQTLAEKIAIGALPVGEVLQIARQVADALAAAHAQGITHRDLKPANIKQRHDGAVKVLDFGLARVTTEVSSSSAVTATGVERTVDGALLGTVPYMSPEQVDGLPVDHRADLWSLGIVLFEMLTQRRPFEGQTHSQTLVQILNAPVPPLEGVAPDLRRIVEGCLDKDRSTRYGTAQELLQDLDACAAKLSGPRSSSREHSRVTIWNSRLVRTLLLSLLVLVAAVSWWMYAARMQRWARTDAIPRARVLAEVGNYAAAYQLALEAQRYVPNEPSLKDLWRDVSRTLAVNTDPTGADVLWKPYSSPDATWQPLGTTPLSGRTLPAGPVRLRITKSGYEPLELAAPLTAYSIALSPNSADAAKVVRIPAGRLVARFSGIGALNATVDEFDIDQHEVTNREYKIFVDAGGYRDRAYWTRPFVDHGRVLSWDAARARFVDSTGQPGPAGWEAGGYPEGADQLPVTGVSWYEAGAYAAFKGRNLPTVYHWFRAANVDDSRFVVPLSNFGERPRAVGSSQAIGSFGAVDMAGNAREWCLNDNNDGEPYILGGAWTDPNYMFTRGQTAPPFDRSSTNGFRTIGYAGGRPPAAQAGSVTPGNAPAYLSGAPAADAVFEIYRGLYTYADDPLNARLTSIDESAELWRRERVEFAAGSGNERMVAYLFLPRRRTPPFACLVHVPSSTAFRNDSGESIRPDAFVLRSGRAMLYPIFMGTFERYAGPSPSQPIAIRDRVIAWGKELSRSVDYLRTRNDIDASKLAYFGHSLGAEVAPIFLTTERRFSAAVLLGGGLSPFFGPLPEANVINFLPRVKVPVLMVNGAYDSILPVTQAQTPMFERLGTAPDQKRHVIVPSGHAVTVPEVRLVVIKEVLDWLDKYLGGT